MGRKILKKKTNLFLLILMMLEVPWQWRNLGLMYMHGNACRQIPLYVLQQDRTGRACQVHKLKLLEMRSHFVLSHVLAIGKARLEYTPALDESEWSSHLLQVQLQLGGCSLDKLLVAVQHWAIMPANFDDHFFVQIVQFILRASNKKDFYLKK